MLTKYVKQFVWYAHNGSLRYWGYIDAYDIVDAERRVRVQEGLNPHWKITIQDCVSGAGVL